MASAKTMSLKNSMKGHLGCKHISFNPFKLPYKPLPTTELTMISNLRVARHNVIAFAKAKSKEKVKEEASTSKEGKGKGATQGDVDFTQLSKETSAEADERMKKCLAVIADNMNTVRTGRANPAILDKIMVESYGTMTPLKQIAAISVPDATTLLIAPYEKSALKSIERAIQESDIGLNPNNDGEKIRLGLPALTEERRKEFTKQVGKFGEDGKIAVRNVRKDSMKRIEKAAFPKDLKKSVEDAVQKLTDQCVKKIDEMVKAKSDDLMKL